MIVGMNKHGIPLLKSRVKSQSKAKKANRSSCSWKRLLRRTSGKCFYCDEKLTIKNRSRDHLIPLAVGGSNGRRNIVPACKKCNYLKGDMLPGEFLKLRKGELCER